MTAPNDAATPSSVPLLLDAQIRCARELQDILDAETRALLATGEQAGELEDALERALVRRTEMAEMLLQRAARTAGTIAYVSAAIGVVVIAVQFYTSYYGPLFAMLR